MRTKDKFDYVRSDGRVYKDCHFDISRYVGGRLLLAMSNEDIGPVAECTTSMSNGEIPCDDTMIAVKTYYEGEGMEDTLKRLGIIEEDPYGYEEVCNKYDERGEGIGYVVVPYYKLTTSGLELLKDMPEDIIF